MAGTDAARHGVSIQQWRAFMDSVPALAAPTVSLWPGGHRHDSLCTARSRAIENQLIAVCRVQFTREPDWRAVLAELERHHVWTLPDASELPRVVKRRAGYEDVVTIDGVGVTVEALERKSVPRVYASGIRTSSPFPEYQDAWAILRLVITFPTTHSPDARQ